MSEGRGRTETNHASDGEDQESCKSASSSSVDTQEFPVSTGWSSENEGGDGKHVQVKKGKERVPRSCPLNGCKSKVVHLPRHLRDVHKWTKEEARKATSRFGLRKSFLAKYVEEPVQQSSGAKKEKKSKDYHRHRRCLIAGCKSVVKRLSNHIQQVHKEIKKGSPVYRQILKEARSLKTWKPSGAAQDNPKVKHEDNFSEEESITDDELPCDLHVHVEPHQEENELKFVDDTEEASVEGDGLQDEEKEENVEIFSSFCQWLQTADGGRKDTKMAKQHCSQVRKILVTIDPEKNLTSLFNKSLVRDKFLKEHAEQKYKPDTVKAHLLSLRNFCSFVLTEEPECITVNAAIIQQVAEKARLWTSSYKKDSNRRHLEKQMEDLENLVTPEMISKFERSESARMAVSYIGELSGAHALAINQSIYTLIRDYVLLELTIANAHRSGVLANMTMGEFEKAKETKQGSMLINVSKHKTADTHGPARVVISPTLFSYLKVYVTEVRRHTTDSESSSDKTKPVFLSWAGAKLESGQISTAINAAWKKGGMEGHICATIFRKSTVTKVHQDHKELKGDLADLMGHKTTTAEKFYRLREKEEACIEAANNLTSIMRAPKEVPVSDQDTPGKAENKNPLPESLQKERFSWNEDDVAAIRELFAGEIKKESVTMAIVRDKIRDHPTLQHLDAKRVCDRVRSEWRQRDPEYEELEDTSGNPSPPEQTESFGEKMDRFFRARPSDTSTYSSSDVVAPSNPSYASNTIFSDEERKYLLRVCGGMVRGGIISKPAVKQLLEKTDEGKKILHKFKIEQLINRLKYERRLNNRQKST